MVTQLAPYVCRKGVFVGWNQDVTDFASKSASAGRVDARWFAHWARADETGETGLAFHEDSEIISMLSPDYFGIRRALPRQSIF